MKAQACRVDILETQYDGPAVQKVIFSYIFKDGKVTCTSPNYNEAMDAGIFGNQYPKRIYPRDGMKFMEALQVDFSGSMIRATAPIPI